MKVLTMKEKQDNIHLYVELVDKKEKHLFSKVLHLFWNGGRCFIILTEKRVLWGDKIKKR